MAKPRPGKPEPEPAKPGELRLLPMLLQVGDRFTDATGGWEVAGRPYTTAGGKMARVRVKRLDRPDVTELRSWAAHERITVRRV